MADEQELNEQEVPGVEDGVEEESSTATTTADEPAERQPKQEKRSDDDDLDSNPKFRKWKSETDRRFAQLEQQYQQQLYQQRQELRNKQMAEMDDYQRLQFELEEERQAKTYAYQQLQQMQVEIAKQQALNEVSSTMGVPVEVLMDAQDINEAWRLAATYQRQSEQQRAAQAAKAAAEKQRQRQEKQQRNAVDTGQGSGSPGNPVDQRFKGARTAQDLAKLYWGAPE